MRKQDDRLSHVSNLMLGEEWLILRHQIDGVCCRDVPVIHDRKASRVEIVANGFDLSARHRRADRASVQHVWEDDVICVAGTACRLSDSILSGNAVAYR